jgi:molecular chaperone IbpA
MNALTRFDTTALNQLSRSLVGFDRIFSDLERVQNVNNYPPYNVVKLSEDIYEIEVAVAGFGLEDIDIEVNQNVLTIRGSKSSDDQSEVEYLHRGLAYREFVRTFTLAEHLIVGDASIKNGVLTVSLSRIIPEELKPRKIQIIEQ